MRQLVRSFRDAFAGLFYCFATQRNMTIHVAIGAAVLLLAFMLKVPLLEMLFLLTAAAAALIAEAFNTALEKAVDVATREKNDLAHIAKDVAAGAVLLTSVYAAVVVVIILGPRLWRLLLR